MRAIEDSRTAPLLAIEPDISFIHRPPAPQARLETNEDTTRAIQTVRANMESEDREHRSRINARNVAAQAAIELAGTQTREQGIVSSFQRLFPTSIDEGDDESGAQIEPYRGVRTVWDTDTEDETIPRRRIRIKQPQYGAIRSSSSSQPSLPFSRPETQIVSKGPIKGNNRSIGQQLLIDDPQQYALTMRTSVVKRMVNQGKLAPELLALRDERDDAEVPIPSTIVAHGRVRKQSNHIDKSRRMDPNLRLPAYSGSSSSG
jgi:hypothetical protein